MSRLEFSFEQLVEQNNLDLVLKCQVGDKILHLVVVYNENKKVEEVFGKVYKGKKKIIDCSGTAKQVFEQVIKVLE